VDTRALAEVTRRARDAGLTIRSACIAGPRRDACVSLAATRAVLRATFGGLGAYAAAVRKCDTKLALHRTVEAQIPRAAASVDIQSGNAVSLRVAAARRARIRTACHRWIWEVASIEGERAVDKLNARIARSVKVATIDRHCLRAGVSGMVSELGPPAGDGHEAQKGSGGDPRNREGDRHESIMTRIRRKHHCQKLPKKL
jgi:hypothetical protein